MRIILKEDISERRGWTKGRALDWERPTITAISTNLGRQDWYEIAEDVASRAYRQSMRGKAKKGDGDGA